MAAQQATAKRGQRTSVSAEAYGAWNQMDANFVPPFYEKSPEHEDFFLQLLSTHPIFAALPAASIRLVIGAIFPHDSAQGEIVIQEGDDGDYLFFVQFFSFHLIRVVQRDEICHRERECAPVLNVRG